MRGAEAKSRLEAEVVASDAAVAMFGLVAGVGPGFRGLADQAARAVTSVPLNLAEGNGRFGRDRVQHFRIAYGSAKEASAALRLLVGTKAVPVEAGQAVLEALDRVQAMTWRLMFGRR
jgi:four helix bundle protein